MPRKSSRKAKPQASGDAGARPPKNLPSDPAKAEKKRAKQLAKLEARLVDAHAVRDQLDALVRAFEEEIAALRGTPDVAAAAVPKAAVTRKPRAARPAAAPVTRRVAKPAAKPATKPAGSPPAGSPTRRPRRTPPPARGS